ncbi:MAG: EpsD family peptidyl-prolyl cis-trans isomerase [Pseudomonadota bacterium]
MKYVLIARVAVLGAALLSLQACESAPTGQVVAVVNGEEVTQAELNEEISQLPNTVAGDAEEIRRQVLQRIVDRRLMAQVAKEERFDREPEFLIRERRLEEALLVQMFSEKLGETVQVPSGAEVDKYLSDNPGKFSERAAYVVDQIVFDFPEDEQVLRALEADQTLADVEQTLERFKVEFVRGTNSLDTAVVPNPVLDQIIALPPGEPFVLPVQGRVTVNVITQRQPVPTTEEEAAPLAAQQMRSDTLQDLLRSRLEEAKAKAEIVYQPGFAPEELAEDAQETEGAEEAATN